MTDETRAQAVTLLRKTSRNPRYDVWRMVANTFGVTGSGALQEPGAVIFGIARDARSFAESISRGATYEETCAAAADMLENKAWP